MTCPKCGTPLPYGAVACNKCGAKFKTVKCPHCGKDIIPGSPFCPACRKDIRWDASDLGESPAPNNKKPLTKRWWFWAVCVVLVLGIIGNIGNAINDSKNTVSQAPEDTSSKVSVAESSQVSASSSTVSLEALTEKMNEILRQNYSGSNIVFDDKTVQVTVWLDGIAAAVATCQQEGRGADDKEWMGAKDGTLALAKSLEEVLDSAGYSDMNVALNFANDQNHDNALLSIYNGDIVYDVLAEEAAPSPTPIAQGSTAGHSGSNNFNTYDNLEQQQTEADYVLNTSSKKVHYKTCDSVKKIAPDNYKEFFGTIDEALAEGYTKCGSCFR